MKKIALIALCTAFTLSATAQTKRIAYRSHSGSNAVFALVEEDNLGLSRPRIEILELEELKKDSSLRADSIKNNQLKKDSLNGKRNQPKKHIPNDTVQNQPKRQKIDNKKEKMIEGDKTDKKQGSFPMLLLVGLLIPTGFVAAIALRK